MRKTPNPVIKTKPRFSISLLTPVCKISAAYAFKPIHLTETKVEKWDLISIIHTTAQSGLSTEIKSDYTLLCLKDFFSKRILCFIHPIVLKNYLAKLLFLKYMYTLKVMINRAQHNLSGTDICAQSSRGAAVLHFKTQLSVSSLQSCILPFVCFPSLMPLKVLCLLT